jgi:hypothetical protein
MFISSPEDGEPPHHLSSESSEFSELVDRQGGGTLQRDVQGKRLHIRSLRSLECVELEASRTIRFALKRSAHRSVASRGKKGAPPKEGKNREKKEKEKKPYEKGKKKQGNRIENYTVDTIRWSKQLQLTLLATERKILVKITTFWKTLHFEKLAHLSETRIPF